MDISLVSRALRPLTAALACTLAGLLLPADAAAQRGMPEPDTTPTNADLFAPLALPDPDVYRDAAGSPGPEYWQQRADYEIAVSLDPGGHRITGSETITYTNNSPDELEFVWVQIDQNLFRTGSRGALMDAGARYRRPTGEGVAITRVEVVQDGVTHAADYRVDGTRMRIELPEPLPAEGGTVELGLDWSYHMELAGGGRTGRLETESGWIWELAQWFPRMAVYDDVEGWNTLPYLGNGEFYLEFGDYDVSITVPRDLIVVATGELRNPDEVLTAEQRRRLEAARGSDETVMIVGRDEVGDPATRPQGDGPLTWRFRAESVRDFAWAASKAFVWDAAAWNDVLVMSVYPVESIGPDEEGNDGWEMSTQYARHTLGFYSDFVSPYPYPVAVNVAGMVGGMEYPMIVFCHWRARGRSLFGVTDHEFGHIWFPMMVASDERSHAWMDEGFNTFMNHYSAAAYYGEASRGRTDPEVIARFMQRPDADQPIMIRADLARPVQLGFLAYAKPGFGLRLLREVVLGEEVFDAAFREYVDRWKWKHPQPSDFFRTMEEVSGHDLAWFWRGWFRTTDVLDQGIESVLVEEGETRIALANHAGLVMPTTLEIEFADGSTRRVSLPVEVWIRGDAYTYPLGENEAAVTHVRLDPDGILPDVDRSNDTWSAEEMTEEETAEE